MGPNSTIVQQLKDNAIAILSLVIAIIALTYSTWREEATEKNRNIRLAAFEVLKNLSELQLVVNHVHYKPEDPHGNPIIGWGYVAFIGDLSMLLPPPIPADAARLSDVWGANWQKINEDEAATSVVSQEIDTMRADIRSVLRHLR